MMRLSKSFFNKTVLRKDLTRYWPLWVVFTILTVDLSDIGFFYGGALESVAYDTESMTLYNFIFARVAAVCMFGDLSNRRLCNCLHTLPLRRETWFATHLLSTFACWFAPVLVKTLIYLTGLQQSWYLAFAFLGLMVVQFLFFLSTAVLSVMCTGTKLAATVMYGLINLGSWLIYYMAVNFYQPLIKGFRLSEDWAVWFSPVSVLASTEWIKVNHTELWYKSTFAGFDPKCWYFGVLGALAVVFFALSLLAYRKRKLECAGDFVAFRWLRPVLWLLISLCFGMLIQGLVLLSGEGTLFLLLGLVVGGLLAQIMVTKSSKHALKGLLKGAILAGIVGISLVVVAIDPMGVTRWTPAPEEVEYVRICDDIYFDETYSAYINVQNYYDAGDIAQIVKAHENLIDEGLTEADTYSTEYYSYREIHITYYLKDGRKVVRQYYYPKDSQADKLLKPLMSRAEYVLGYENWSVFIEKTRIVTVECNGEEYQLDWFQSTELLKVMKTDCDTGTWDDRQMWDGYCIIKVDNKWIIPSSGCVQTYKWLNINVLNQSEK